MKTSGLLQSNRSPKGFTLTLQETRSIHDSMNIPKIEFIAYIYILYYQSRRYVFNVTLTSVNKQRYWMDLTLARSNGAYIVCGCGLNRVVHEGMNHISNVKVHLKTRSRNVNIVDSTLIQRHGVESTLNLC